MPRIRLNPRTCAFPNEEPLHDYVRRTRGSDTVYRHVPDGMIAPEIVGGDYDLRFLLKAADELAEGGARNIYIGYGADRSWVMNVLHHALHDKKPPGTPSTYPTEIVLSGDIEIPNDEYPRFRNLSGLYQEVGGEIRWISHPHFAQDLFTDAGFHYGTIYRVMTVKLRVHPPTAPSEKNQDHG
jgi:hypothetical protein